VSIIQSLQVNGLVSSTVGGTGIAVKYFPRPLGSSIGVLPTTPSATNANGSMQVPGINALNGQKWTINARGTVYTDPTIACPTVTVAVYAVTGWGTLGQLPNNPVYTAIASTGGLTGGSLALNDEPFSIEAVVDCTTASGLLEGIQTVIYNNVLVNSTPKVLSASVTGINMGAVIPFSLVVGVTFSISGANNLATLTEFDIDA
jgi:hypothetical protein